MTENMMRVIIKGIGAITILVSVAMIWGVNATLLASGIITFISGTVPNNSPVDRYYMNSDSPRKRI